MVKSEIKPVKNEEIRQIRFSKRRQSLFNKASEISILCGAMVGSVVFSTIGTSFSFGHPSIDAVANRFLGSGTSDDDPPTSGAASNSNSLAVSDSIQPLNKEYSELQQALNSEKNKIDMLHEATEKEMGGHMMKLLNTNIWELDLDELQEFQKYMEAIHGVVEEETKMPEKSQTQGLVPQPSMGIAPDQQYQFGDDLSLSDNEFIDGLFDVDSPCLSGDLHDDACGLGNNFPDNQNHG